MTACSETNSSQSVTPLDENPVPPVGSPQNLLTKSQATDHTTKFNLKSTTLW
jgi:hypothetical protein